LLKIGFYDFSNSCSEKIYDVLRGIEHIRTKTLSNRDNILSWEQVAEKHIDVIKHG